MEAATQIINVGLNRKLILDKDALKEILKDDIKDLPVVVISIVGTYRQGKSFLLNFFLRFLTLTCKEKRTAEDWLNPEDGTLSGFVWKMSPTRQTIGIMMWPEIFISKDKNGDDVAIVLLDTQGTYDNQTSMKDFAAITALSTLISSVQIYNMKDNIKQNELLSLKDFLDYGKLIHKEDSGAPFQNLTFLIRDWIYWKTHSYGGEGGQEYLKKELNINPDDPEDLVNLKESIKKFFNSTSAFLLPAPGDQVVKNATNDLTEMDDDFKTYVKLLVEKILKPENLVLKEINGTRVKVSDLFILIKKYHELFQSGKMPSVTSMFQATAEVQLQSTVEDCVKTYLDLMSFDKIPNSQAEDDANLETRHEANKLSTLDGFDKMKTMGDEQTKLKYRDKLIEIIETAFSTYQEKNYMKLEHEKLLRELEALKERNNKTDVAINSLNEQLGDAKAQCEQNTVIIKNFEKEMEQLKEDKKAFERRSNITGKAINSLNKQLEDARSGRTQDKGKIEELEKRMKQMKEDKQTCEKESNKTEEAINSLNKQIEFVNVQSEQYKKKIEGFEKEIKQLKQGKEINEKEIEELKKWNIKRMVYDTVEYFRDKLGLGTPN